MNALVSRGEWKIAVQSPPHGDPLNQVVDVWIASTKFAQDRLHLAVPMTFGLLEEAAAPGSPTLRLELDSASDLCTALLDALREAGVIAWSTDKSESEATQRHLEDMRRLVFQEKEVDGERGEQ